MSKWISLKERIPKDNQEVLIRNSNGAEYWVRCHIFRFTLHGVKRQQIYWESLAGTSFKDNFYAVSWKEID